MSRMAAGRINTVMHEDRKFPPSAEFAARARVSTEAEYLKMYELARDRPDAFWRELALGQLHWFQPFQTVLEREAERVRWFEEIGRAHV